jgi:hypothetical protein
MNAVSLRKSVNDIILVLPYSFDEIRGHPNIESAIPFARQNINGRMLIQQPLSFNWIPAFAGMTNNIHH